MLQRRSHHIGALDRNGVKNYELWEKISVRLFAPPRPSLILLPLAKSVRLVFLSRSRLPTQPVDVGARLGVDFQGRWSRPV